MTAELDGDQEKKTGEKEIEVEKTPSPRDENAPQNGDMKKEGIEEEKKEGIEEEEKKEKDGDAEEKKKSEDEEKKEDEEEEVVPQPKKPCFWKRLFGRGKENKQDVEAGTELLSKEAKAEIKPEDEGKNGKGTSTNDVTVAVDAEGGEETKSAKEKVEEKKRSYWKRVAISLVCIILVLAVVTVVSVITTASGSHRGPLGEPLVVTDCGPVRGYKENEIYVFKGIPYAMPPIGELRWKPPMQAASLNDCWTGTYEAYNSSATCYQKQIPGHHLEMSEDCLYLDVITPSLLPPVPRPVVVYIPGDHPMKGFTADDVNWRPTASIADKQEVTFVTINYRTNVFGFLVHDLLTERMRPPTSGNYGIMDMIAALKWVQRNIRSFGGDPNKVTVLAHGGGATAALALLASKKAENLFSQMWLTAPSTRFSNDSLKDISTENAPMLTKLNCDTLSCLYNKTSEEILAATPGFWAVDWAQDVPSSDEEHQPKMVVVDGDIIKNTPVHMWQDGVIQQIPVVVGAAAQESGSSKMIHDLATWSWTDFGDYVSEKLETLSDNVTRTSIQYYMQNNTTPQQQFHSLVSDVRTVCPLERLTEKLAEALQTDSYWYLVDYLPSSPIQFSNESASVRLSVHGMDIAAIFGILDNYIKPMSASDQTFQMNLQDLFYSFVKNGRPEIRGEMLMSSNFINMIGESVRSRMAPYESCHIWSDEMFYSTYAKMN